MKRALAIVTLFLTVGCIDVPAMNGLIDRITPEERKTYETFVAWEGEGSFAPDDDQDVDSVYKAVMEMVSKPLEFQKTLQNLSWRDNPHEFKVESNWEARYVLLILTVNYEALGGSDLSEGPAGTLDISIKDPEGGEHGEGYEIVTWNDQITERPYLLPPIYGTWNVVISGSGLDGGLGTFYSGDYSLRVESERLE